MVDTADLVDTPEMYLKAVLELEEEGITPLRARLAERFMHSSPTVSQTVARLERHGLVTLEADRQVALTPMGRSAAEAIMRKHRLAEAFLHRIVGLEWEFLHAEACRWEHVMSDRVERLLDAALGHPARSPYGNPIRGRTAHPHQAIGNLVGLAAHADPGGQALPVRGTVLWIGEPLQADPEALAYLHRSGLLPQTAVAFARDGENVRAYVGEEECELVLPREFALHVFAVLKNASSAETSSSLAGACVKGEGLAG